MVKIEMHVLKMNVLWYELILLFVTRLVNKTWKECYAYRSSQKSVFAGFRRCNGRTGTFFAPGFENGSIAFENGTI
jgi:hypothetical protein